MITSCLIAASRIFSGIDNEPWAASTQIIKCGMYGRQFLSLCSGEGSQLPSWLHVTASGISIHFGKIKVGAPVDRKGENRKKTFRHFAPDLDWDSVNPQADARRRNASMGLHDVLGFVSWRVS